MRFYLVLSALAGLALADLNQKANEMRDVQDAVTTRAVHDNKMRDEQDAVTTRVVY